MGCAPQIGMLAVMFGIFYFLLIRPQQKKAKEHQDLLRALKKGDRVVTNGGIFGTITGIDDRIAVIEISEKVRIKVLRSQVAGKADSSLESLNNR
ncbi:MAG: preprotein translocase subunit YajC [Deltaproteobacteria bacterium]|nr:preprotein translocase subunit YajC [Deltaproteobacteria bacterium]